MTSLEEKGAKMGTFACGTEFLRGREETFACGTEFLWGERRDFRVRNMIFSGKKTLVCGRCFLIREKILWNAKKHLQKNTNMIEFKQDEQ